MPQNNPPPQNPDYTDEQLDRLLPSENKKSDKKPTYDYPTPGELGTNLGIGAVKGIASDWESLRDAYSHSVFPFVSEPLSPGSPNKTKPIPLKYREPANWQEGAGKQVERLLEYMGAMGTMGAPPSMLPLELPVTQGLTAGAVAGMHSGWDPRTMAGNAALGAAMVPIARGLSTFGPFAALRNWLAEHAPTPPPGAGAWMRGAPVGAMNVRYSWDEPGGQTGGEAPPTPEPPPTPSAPVGGGPEPGPGLNRPSPETEGQSQFQGQEGGLGPKPHQDVVAQRPMLVRTKKGDGSGARPGTIRLETPNELEGRMINFGRGRTQTPHYDAEPLKLPIQPQTPRPGTPTPPPTPQKGAKKK